MSLSAITNDANQTADTSRNTVSQNHMILIARSAGNPCERFIAQYQPFISRALGSIQQISDAIHINNYVQIEVIYAH